ncbi:hypothetical protein A1OE_316 [Candidatus Endolissoclinum faulkneri L2]|uniref:Uncharacterized protein n=1 Tax=Candidatus Endolissoclinum faulkneri L2 TaxID=1193729 RepID=K7YPM0_9PROT|nr:hypothetical protein A1OE_316 [Candidatus Endolissoclinum faulkneri L2]
MTTAFIIRTANVARFNSFLRLKRFKSSFNIYKKTISLMMFIFI